ncbi:MAG: AmmeMemoRadiSam system protein A [Deltaproteobacteria bacterium]|jgi:AmmeMemoRadiSam system protein A
MELTKKEKDSLLDMAKKTIAAKVNNKEMPKFKVDSATLKEERGAFVTLKKHGHLRGCIGYIKAVQPLWETVHEMALAAAFHDPRFPSLKPEELKELTFEISVLSPLQRVKDISEIQVGKHGLYIVCGSNSGLLLPQVASEYGWDRETFLKETCGKAGLQPSAWQDQETEIYIFSADYFSDAD